MKSAGTYSWDGGYSLCVDVSGNVYVAGGFNDSQITFDSITITTPPWPASLDPIFVVKYDPNGNALCGSSLISGGDDLMGICTDNSNVYVASDFTLSPFFVGPDSLFMTGGAEFIFVAKLKGPTVPKTDSLSNNNFFLPNAFSPNNDGHNDLFTLKGWKNNVKEFNIIIYDRWGEKVFESNDPEMGWDGTYKGKLTDPAVFVYSINATSISGDKIIRKGTISLIR